MGRFVDQVRVLVRGYTRKGGKDNRRQQAARMIAFAHFCESMGVSEVRQVGARHVIRYWRQCRHLSIPTLYNHHRALCLLWGLAGLPAVPPKPKLVRSDDCEQSESTLYAGERVATGEVQGGSKVGSEAVAHDVHSAACHW